MKPKPWHRPKPRLKKVTCCECAGLREWCRTFVRYVDGTFGYVCKRCWYDCEYGLRGDTPGSYLKLTECPVVK